MKSLEILEIYLKVAEEEMEEDKVKNAIINNLNQIKADLEVLEIIRNKQANISYLKRYFDDKRFTLKDIHYLTTLNNMYLTMEELLKIKQWLEERE